MEKRLNLFEIGEFGYVKAVEGSGPIRHRMFDMGITPGTRILLRKRAPLGDPIEINLRGYELTLRVAEAEAVLMDSEGI